MGEIILLHTREKNLCVTIDELIENAKEQERKGIKPGYAFLDYKTGEPCLPAGWLVYSTWQDGAGVVYKRTDGKYIFIRGWQGDFCLT